MKQTFKIIAVIILTSIITISCESKKDTPKENHQNEISVELDNGNKWIANTETTEGIKKMQLIMYSFSDAESIKEYKLLKEELEVEFTNIFTLCTMKGESHNQLHNYLKPMIAYFDGLDSNELITCKTNFNDLQNHLKEYSNYFK